jgi:ferrochelatase
MLDKLRLFYNHPGFIEPLAANLLAVLAGRGRPAEGHRIVFTAHSIPVAMAAACSYREQLAEATRLTMEAAGLGDRAFDLVFQSRSGPPTVPWLEPDVNDHLASLAAEGVAAVALVPIGFISDHMEVLFDLDTQAAATAADLGLDLVRVPTVGTAPRFVTMIRELIEERLISSAPRLHLGTDGPWPNSCPGGHCNP